MLLETRLIWHYKHDDLTHILASVFNISSNSINKLTYYFPLPRKINARYQNASVFLTLCCILVTTVYVWPKFRF